MQNITNIRVIHNDLQYAAYLDEVKCLAIQDPVRESSEGERLEILSMLLERYEKARFTNEKPDPIDAIHFRMAELGLKQKDLAEILGSKSRASEILSRKRSLTLDMVRILHFKLGIPAEILIENEQIKQSSNSSVNWNEFPVSEMVKRGWLGNISPKEVTSEIVKNFIKNASATANLVLLRRSLTGSVVLEDSDKYALYAWIARILIKSRDDNNGRPQYTKESITNEFLQQVAKLSWVDKGPLLAKEFLAMKGIALVIEPHLPKTRLDGAVTYDQDGTPVIGLTIRYDRLDSFWFTLMHELVHLQKHLTNHNQAFVDSTDNNESTDKIEMEADLLAAEAFIPRHIWRTHAASRTKTVRAINKLADELRVHPAIIAGRIRRESGNYRILSNMVGNKQVRKLFPEITWQ